MRGWVARTQAGVAVRQPYIRVVGLEESTDGNARGNLNFTTSEEAAFKQFAAQPNVLNEIRSKIAPAIFGVDDVKAAVACLLFGAHRCRRHAAVMRDGLSVSTEGRGQHGTARPTRLHRPSCALRPFQDPTGRRWLRH
jgi:hypothetical protein